MDLKHLTIGQMAKLNNISQQALRLYDREGLLNPMVVDSETGYRYYDIIQSARLDLIQYMKGSGMTLKEIRHLLDSENKMLIKELLYKQKKAISESIKKLEASKRAVERTLSNYHKYETLPPTGTIFMEYIPERLIYHYKCDINFFDQNYTDYEFILRSLRQRLATKNLSMTYFCNVGSLTRKEMISKRKYFSNEIFMFVDKEDEAIATGKLPSAAYLCICADGFYKEKESAQKLLDYIENNGFTIDGDYLCEVLAEFPIFENSRRNMFLKMQIPIIPPK